MNSLRARLILSHILPQLIILPLLAIILAYVIETQFLLTDLANNFKSVALLAAQNAAVQPTVWQDSTRAEEFVRLLSSSQKREIILIKPNGEVQADPLADMGPLTQLQPDDLAALLSGQTLVRSQYNFDLNAMHVEALAPVLDSRQVVIGIVRVTDRLGNVYQNIQFIRNLEIIATLLALLIAVAMGIWLARRLEIRLQGVMTAIEKVANPDSPYQIQGLQASHMLPEFVRLFTAVNELSSRLRSSEEARKKLLANLVHEVARPLGALQAAVHALQRGAADDTALRNDLLQGMDDQIERLKPLLDNLASLYVLSEQPIELHKEKVNLGKWLLDILVTWQAAAQTRGLEWRCNLQGNLPIITIDPDRMAQVIGNLVSNAIQYTPNGGHIQVTAGAESNQVWISIEDTGIGITPEERLRIFEPLYRGSRARRFPQGMGLGLAIADEIIRLHSGTLEVNSEEGHGSCFILRLPLPPSS